MKTLLISIVCTMVLSNAIAQKKEKVVRTKKTAVFVKYDHLMFSKFFNENQNQLGVFITYKVSKRAGLSLSYNRWVRAGEYPFSMSFNGIFSKYAWDNMFSSENCTDCNLLSRRENYQFIDIGGNYKILNLKKWGSFTTTLNGSVAWGINTIRDTHNTTDLPDVFESTSHEEKASYIGIDPKIAYNIPLWKNRILLGAHAGLRKYLKLDDTQYEIGFQIGYQF